MLYSPLTCHEGACCPWTLLVSAQVPSHTAVLVAKLVDMLGENVEGHYIPPGVHFQDQAGAFSFRDKVASYLEGFTTRVCANVFTPQGGGAGSNNATESLNKVTHQDIPVRKAPVAHTMDLLRHMHTCSSADNSFDDALRRDMWHHDHMIVVERLRNMQPYPACPSCSFNLMDCHFVETVHIERLDHGRMRFAPSPGADPSQRVLDFKKAMKTERVQCIVLPTYKTMQTIINNHPEVFQAHRDMAATARVQLIKDFLSAPTKKPTVGPSWLASFVRFHNTPATMALEDMSLSEWYALVHSFALMPPLTGPEAVVRYLSRLEKGVPIRDKSSTREGNGCVVHWDKVPDSGIVYCLCADHSLRGICWHVMLWLVSNNVVSLPPKWSAATIAGPSVRGRDRHYVDGNALLRDRQPGASKHALAKIARSALDPRSPESTTQSLISCMGIINMETDSVRKYTQDKYTHAKEKTKRKDKQNTNNKKGKQGKRKRKPAVIDESQDESGEEESREKTKSKDKTKGKRKDKSATSDESQDESAGAEESRPDEAIVSPRASAPRAAKRARPTTWGKQAAHDEHASAEADAQGAATAKYVKVLGMARVSRQDKLDLLRALVAGEVDKSLQSMLQDFLVEDRCNLVQLKDILEGVD